MGVNVSAATSGALWPLTPQATPTLSAVSAGSGTVETPTTSGEFVTAWETLSAGTGGTIDASGVTDVEGTLNIANGGAGAVVVQGGSYKNLNLTNVQNLRFENAVGVTAPQTADGTYKHEIELAGCTNIQFIDCSFIYDADDSIKEAYRTDTVSPYQRPLACMEIGVGCSNVLIDGCYFYGYFTGIDIVDVSNVEILNSEWEKTQMDDIRGGEWVSVRIEGNYMHDQYALDWDVPEGFHKDCIQIWSNNSGDHSDGITIKNNIFKHAIASGQVIFANIGTGGNINNVLVENNLIYSYHTHGITFFAGVTNSTITRNTVLKNPDAYTTGAGGTDIRLYDTRIWDRAGGNTVTDNVCEIITTGTGTVSSGNYFVTYGNGSLATDAVNHFQNPMEGADATLADLKMKTGSILFGSTGSTLL